MGSSSGDKLSRRVGDLGHELGVDDKVVDLVGVVAERVDALEQRAGIIEASVAVLRKWAEKRFGRHAVKLKKLLGQENDDSES